MFSFLPVSGNHIWGKESQIAVRVDSIVLVTPVFDDNTGFCQRKEPLLIETLITQTIMETFHIGILPRTSRFDVERFDSILTEILSGNPGDKLRAIVGTNVPGIPRSAIARLRAANTSCAFRLRATVSADAFTGKLVDQGEDPQGSTFIGSVRYKIPAPNMVGMLCGGWDLAGGLAHYYWL